MEPGPARRPSWLPATSPAVPPPVVPEPPPPGPGAPSGWRRITRTPRGAAGLTIATAALLLWPFSGWSVLPWLAGIGLLLLLRLLRLDGLLRGWVLHLGGLVVVVGLMVSTGPWAWALAGSIGVLLAGLAQLPWWKLAAVGVVLCVVSGIGYGFAARQDRLELEQMQARAGDAARAEIGVSRVERVLPTLMEGIAVGNSSRVCALLGDVAEADFIRSRGGTDCPAVVTALSGEVVDRAAYSDPMATVVQTGPSTWSIDACRTTWSTPAAGPQLGQFSVEQTTLGKAFVVVEFSPCSSS